MLARTVQEEEQDSVTDPELDAFHAAIRKLFRSKKAFRASLFRECRVAVVATAQGLTAVSVRNNRLQRARLTKNQALALAGFIHEIYG